jgi:hypothetical protein
VIGLAEIEKEVKGRDGGREKSIGGDGRKRCKMRYMERLKDRDIEK